MDTFVGLSSVTGPNVLKVRDVWGMAYNSFLSASSSGDKQENEESPFPVYRSMIRTYEWFTWEKMGVARMTVR